MMRDHTRQYCCLLFFSFLSFVLLFAQVLIDKSLLGWKEYALEVMRPYEAVLLLVLLC